MVMLLTCASYVGSGRPDTVFNSSPVLTQFVLDIVELGKVCVRVLEISPVISIPPQLHTTHSFVRYVMWSALFSNTHLAEDFKSCLGQRLCSLKESVQFSQCSEWVTGWKVLGSNFFGGKKFFLTQIVQTDCVAHQAPYLNTGILLRTVKRLEIDVDHSRG